MGCPVEAYSSFGSKMSSPVQKLLLSLGEMYQVLRHYKLDEAADFLHSLAEPQRSRDGDSANWKGATSRNTTSSGNRLLP